MNTWTPVGPPTLAVKLFPSLDEWLTAESRDYWMLVNGWVWWMYRGRLQGHLCEEWGPKTQQQLGCVTFNACTGWRRPPEKNHLFGHGLKRQRVLVNIWFVRVASFSFVSLGGIVTYNVVICTIFLGSIFMLSLSALSPSAIAVIQQRRKHTSYMHWLIYPLSKLLCTDSNETRQSLKRHDVSR